MELNVQTVLVVLGVIVMLGILIDGFRRMRRVRHEALKIDVQGDFKFPEEGFSSELPNGGARVTDDYTADVLLGDVRNVRDQLENISEEIELTSSEENVYAGEPDFQRDSYSWAETEAAEQAEESSETSVLKAKNVNLDEHVPLLMDVEQLGSDSAANVVKSAPAKKAVMETVTMAGDHVAVNDNSAILKPKVDKEEGLQDEQQEQEMVAQAAYSPVKKPGLNAESLASRDTPDLVLVTNVVPQDEEGFCGEDILYLVNKCDLRHGEKEIFHRFEKTGGEGNIQFSMANSFKPGTFNPEELLHERIYGLSLFMSLPGPENAMDAFEAMTEMAAAIARNLGGDVHDDSHSIMALQTIEHNRQQVRDFVRKQKLMSKK